MFTTRLPPLNETFRDTIYAGDIYKLPATPLTQAFCRDVRLQLEQEFGALGAVHERFTFHSMKQPLSILRAQLASSPVVRDIAAAAGLAACDIATDSLRLRCVLQGGHQDRGAAMAYSAHRDTWYGNPQSQLNFWIPLQDVTPDQSFRFYPEAFRKALRNTSKDFRYDDWTATRGWQGAKSHDAAAYPALLEPVTGGDSFAAKAGDIIIFSAAQLHQTVENDAAPSRFSLDFRVVHVEDHRRGFGAPNADNASAPDALRDYAFPEGRAA